MPAWTDWIFWGLGVIFGLWALVGLVRALFADRPRGRARCPKCWYDLSSQRDAGVLVCPECGRDARRPRRLRKTRRHYVRAALMSLLLVLAAVSAFVPTALTKGWAHVLPTPALAFFLPFVQDRSVSVGLEIEARISEAGEEGLPSWQRRLYAWAAARAMASERHVDAQSLGYDVAITLGGHAAAALDELIDCAARTQKWIDQTRHIAAGIARDAGALGEDGRHLIDDLVVHAEGEWIELRVASLEALAMIDPHDERVRRTLLAAAIGDEANARVTAIDGLSIDPETRSDAIAAIHARLVEQPIAALRALIDFAPFDDSAIHADIEALASNAESSLVRVFALRALQAITPPSRPIVVPGDDTLLEHARSDRHGAWWRESAD